MKISVRILLALALAAGVRAQDAPKGSADQPSKNSVENRERDPGPTYNFFKLAFTVSELEDGKRTNQRDYMMILRTDNQPSSIRVGTRVPIYTEETKEDKKYTYIDVGLNIRCDVKEQTDRKLQSHCDFEISGFISPEKVPGSVSAVPSAPILRTTRVQSWSMLTLGKPTVISTVDDVNSARRMQIEVTATKLD